MKKSLCTLAGKNGSAPTGLLSILVLLLAGLPPAVTAQPLDPAKSTAALREQMAARPGDRHQVYLLMADRLDVRAMARTMERQRLSPAERSARLLPALREKARTTQQAVLNWLHDQAAVPQHSIRSFWAINAVFAELPGALIDSLSRRADIAFIDLNHPIAFDDEAQSCNPQVLPAIPNSTEPGLRAINAPAMWAEGYTGYGRKALIVDSGQEGDHPALRNQFAYQNFPLEQVWAGTGEVAAVSSHGTHVTGTVVGLDRLNRDTIGVAFNGMWMGGPSNLGSPSPNPTFQGLLDNLQWALDPDGNPDTADDIPDVINNSWTSGPIDCAFQRSLYEDLFASYDALGIAVVFSAGNSGPAPSTITSPKFLFLDSINIFAVGNVDANSSNIVVNSGSSRGPSPCDGTDQERIKPEVVAPGTFVRSAVQDGGYSFFTGTSMAAPHTAGAVLLLKEAFPFLPGKELLNALYQSAVDLGPPGEENTHGRGLIDVYAAYQYLIQQGHSPVLPVDRSRDVLLLDADLSSINCKGAVPLRLLVENGGEDTLRTLDVRFIARLGDLRDTSVASWAGKLAPRARQWLDLEDLAAPVGEQIEVQISISNPNGQPDPRHLNNSLKDRILVLDAEKVPAGPTEGTRACSESTVLLESELDTPGTIRWYEQESGGEPIAEGRSVLLDAPAGQSDLTVFAETEFQVPAGKPMPGEDATVLTTRGGLAFDCINPFVLRSVKVFAEEGGNRLLRLRIPGSGVVNKVVNVPGPGEHRIPLDIAIEPGTDYELTFFSGKGLRADQRPGQTSYPYLVPGVVSITGSTVSQNFYLYFYDWEIEYVDPCGRTQVSVNIDEAEVAPEAAFTPSDTLIDLANGGQVTFADASTGASSWSWDFGDGNTSTAQSPTHTFTDEGVYAVSLKAANTPGCTDVSREVVEVVRSTAAQAPKPLDDAVRVFPNPTTGMVQVRIAKPLEGRPRLRVVDMLGRQVMPERQLPAGAQRFELDLSTLPGGPYTLILRSAQGRAVKRLLRM